MLTKLICTSPSPLFKEPIVLLNGWGLSQDVWGTLIPFLQPIADVIIVELVYEDDIDALCETVIPQLPEKSILLGWSLGGMIATKIAADRPELVAGLVTLASNWQFVADQDWPQAMPAETFLAFYQSYKNAASTTLKRFLGLVVQGDEGLREQKRYIKSLACSDNAFPYNDGLAGLHLLRDVNNKLRIQQVTCPALHVFGEADHLVPVSVVQDMQAIQPRHEYFIVEHAGHLLHQPVDRIAPVLTRFFEGL